MRILTADEILAKLTGEGLHLKKDTFKYYLKTGLLYAQDRKTKKRLKEGIISLYAEVMVERLKRILELKGSGLTLEEIKLHLLEQDRKELAVLYEAAGINAYPKENIDARVIRWRKDGYYRGLLSIYDDILNTLNTRLEIHKAQAEELDKLKGSIGWQVCHQDKRLVEQAFERKISSLLLGLEVMEKSISGLMAKKRVLGSFLDNHVDGYKSRSID